MSRDEMAFEFVMGGLSPLERDAVAHERQSDPLLDAAIRGWETSLSPITGMAGTLAPPHDLFDRITNALAKEQESLAGMTIVPFEEGEWRHVAPGIEVRPMWTRRTILLRCQPGAIVPAHSHTETENIVVLSGDFVLGGRTFGMGDWHSAPPGSHHDDAHSTRGCLLLIQCLG